MHVYWKLFALVVLLLCPIATLTGCGPAKVSSDVTPDNTGDDNTEEDNSGEAGSEDDE